jgi:hypothetical protein
MTYHMFSLQGAEDPSQRRRAVGDVDTAASKHRGGRSNGTAAREPEARGGGDTTGTVRAASRDGGSDLFLCDAIGAFIFISSRSTIGNSTDIVFLFLQSGYVTGQTLSVDGGLLCEGFPGACVTRG